MASTLNPYLSFKDDARAAMEFYRDALGGDLEINTFGDYGDKDAPEANLVMHSQLDHPERLHPDGIRHPTRHDLPGRRPRDDQPQW